MGPISPWVLYSPSGSPLRLSSLTEDTWMITVSSCGVKLQEVLSGLEKERLKHWRYTCTFVAFLNIIFVFLSTWGVIWWFKYLQCNSAIVQARTCWGWENNYNKKTGGKIARGLKFIKLIWAGENCLTGGHEVGFHLHQIHWWGSDRRAWVWAGSPDSSDWGSQQWESEMTPQPGHRGAVRIVPL